MPRTARIVAPGYPHHITQRGNNKQETFSEDKDYSRYLEWLKKYSGKHEMSTLAYCLVPNHVHFIAIPEQKSSFAKTFDICNMLYAQYFNAKNDMTGHLWQGRFYSCVLDEDHLYAAIRYVENNPVRAGLVKKAEDWEWSSARAHLNKEKSILPLGNIDKFITISDWESYLKDHDEAITAKIKSNTISGKPLGNDRFVSKLEKLFGKQLKPIPRGRPRK